MYSCLILNNNNKKKKIFSILILQEFQYKINVIFEKLSDLNFMIIYIIFKI